MWLGRPVGWLGGGVALPARVGRVAGGGGASEALRWALVVGGLVVVTTAVIAVLVWLGQVWLVLRVLRDRVSFDQVPSRAFAPSPAAVLGQVQAWIRARPLAVLVPRRAFPIRVSLVLDEDGLLRHRVTVAARAASVLRSSVLPQVELRAVTGEADPPPSMADFVASTVDGAAPEDGEGG